MSITEFLEIRRELRTISDLRRFPYPRGVLFTILSQKKVDMVKRRYPMAIQRLEEIASYWSSKKHTPAWLNLTPVMKVRILLKALGFSKSEVAKSLRNPTRVEDEKLRDCIWGALFSDFVYSPLAVKHQFARGKLGEEIIRKWLEKNEIEYRDEKDMKGESEKTPDFFLSKPIRIEGKEVSWIESKALFGDPRLHWIYSKKQYSLYHKLFGEGVVVYWFGYVKGLDKLNILDGSSFSSPMRNTLLDMRIYTKGLEGYPLEKLEKLIRNLAISSVVDLANAEEIECARYVRIPELESTKEFGNYMCTKEFIEGMCKLIDLYSRGRILVVCKEKDWRRCHRRHISWVLRNLGFEVVHL